MFKPCTSITGTSDWLALIGGIAGLVLVIGSLILLFFGKIRLETRVGDQPAIIVQYPKMFNINIAYPALGLFFLGIVFLFGAYYFYSNLGVKHAKVRIVLDTDDPEDARAIFVGNFGTSPPDPGNSFEKDIPCSLTEVQVTILETGYKKWEKVIYLDEIQESYKVKLAKTVDRPSKDPAQIINPTPGVKLPKFSTEDGQ